MLRIWNENGRYWFHGRFDDIIKTGGFRGRTLRSENVLMEHPAVVECSVIGVPDALRGQAIKAVIVLGAGYEPSPELELKIKNFCNQKLAEYKWIRLVEFVTEMPKTISGKIQKTVLLQSKRNCMKMNVCIKGVGCDTVSIPRLEEKMTNTRLADMLFTEYEQNYIADKQIYSAAGIWAAKEAVSKSLGTGFCGFTLLRY